jgi:hypothetical protein
MGKLGPFFWTQPNALLASAGAGLPHVRGHRAPAEAHRHLARAAAWRRLQGY